MVVMNNHRNGRAFRRGERVRRDGVPCRRGSFFESSRKPLFPYYPSVTLLNPPGVSLLLCALYTPLGYLSTGSRGAAITFPIRAPPSAVCRAPDVIFHGKSSRAFSRGRRTALGFSTGAFLCHILTAAVREDGGSFAAGDISRQRARSRPSAGRRRARRSRTRL